MNAVAERDVERRFRERGNESRALVFKLTSPGNAGVPDRLCVFPDGEVAFVELKAPGGKPRPLQRRVFDKLGHYGHPVTIIDSIEGADAFWDADEEVKTQRDASAERAGFWNRKLRP